MREAAKQGEIGFAPRQEEELPRTEDSRDAIGGNSPFLEFVQIGRPKLVLDKESHPGLQRIQEPTCVATCRERQVQHVIHTVVVLTQLIARGREERQHDAAVRLLFAQTLNERTCLLELAHRRHMDPNSSFADMFQSLLALFLTLHHQTCFAMTEQSGETYHKKVKNHNDSIKILKKRAKLHKKNDTRK